MNVVVVDPRKLQLEFGQDWASKYWYIVVTVVVVFVAIVVNVAVIVVDPRILSLNSGQNRVNDKWDIVDVFVSVVVPEIYLLNQVNYFWDIAYIKFLWCWWVMVVVCKVIYIWSACARSSIPLWILLLVSSKCSHSTCSWELNFYWNFMPSFAFIRSWTCYHYKLKLCARRCPKK